MISTKKLYKRCKHTCTTYLKYEHKKKFITLVDVIYIRVILFICYQLTHYSSIDFPCLQIKFKAKMAFKQILALLLLQVLHCLVSHPN